jgi:uncharacterized membrane protein YvlD (DUF360 family)
MSKPAKASPEQLFLSPTSVLPRRKLPRKLWWARYIVVRMGGRAVGLWAAARLLESVSLSRSVSTLIAAVLLLEVLSFVTQVPGRWLTRPGVTLPLLIGIVASTGLNLWIVDLLLSGLAIDGLWAYPEAAVIFLVIGAVLSWIFDPTDAVARFEPFARARAIRATRTK